MGPPTDLVLTELPTTVGSPTGAGRTPYVGDHRSRRPGEPAPTGLEAATVDLEDSLGATAGT